MLILGVDGGGSKTAAQIARIASDRTISVIGSGQAGPSNVRAVGLDNALTNLDAAVDAALDAAQCGGEGLAATVLGLAGSSLPDVQSQVASWAKQRALSPKIDIVHDADPVLAAGLKNGIGIALIVGTGSVAVGVNSDGERLVSGGWGHWFGDLGSGFDLGRQALAAVAKAVDGIGPTTSLVEKILKALEISNPREIIMMLQQAKDIRREIASLAPVLLDCAASGDDVAAAVVNDGAAATASLVTATAQNLGLTSQSPLAVAGGIACGNEYYRESLTSHLSISGFTPSPLVLVTDPVDGCLIMARDLALDDSGSRR